MKSKPPRRAPVPDEEGKVPGYLAVKRLRKAVAADFAAMSDEQQHEFWLLPEFGHIRIKKADERDRLTVGNVLARIDHCRKPSLWGKWHRQVKEGKMTLAEFVKRVIAKSPFHE